MINTSVKFKPRAYCMVQTPDGEYSIPLHDIKEYFDNPLLYSAKILKTDINTLLDYIEWYYKGSPFMECSGTTSNGRKCRVINHNYSGYKLSFSNYLFIKSHVWYCRLHENQAVNNG
jgi:hypothetical protein